MPVCHGVQSFVLATQATVFHACSVDLSWQTTIHACQRCPRAALTLSAATAAIATQSNVEGTTSRFCPAGVHMGKCVPAEVYTEALGSSPNATPALSGGGSGGGLVSRLSQKFAELSKNANSSVPPPPLIEPWVPPDLPLPTTVHSKASFSPTVPISVQSPLLDEGNLTPSSAASSKKLTVEEKGPAVTTKEPEPSAEKVVVDVKPSIKEQIKEKEGKKKVEVEKQKPTAEVSPVREPPKPPTESVKTKEDITPTRPVKEPEREESGKTSAAIPTDKVERLGSGNGTAPPSSLTPTPVAPDIDKVASVDRDVSAKDDSDVSARCEVEAVSPSTISSVSPRFVEQPEETKENLPATPTTPTSTTTPVVEEDVTPKPKPSEGNKKLPSPAVEKPADRQAPPNGDAIAAPKPFPPSKQVPQFYIPMGRTTLSVLELDKIMEKVKARIFEGLADPLLTQKKTEEDGQENGTKEKNKEPPPVVKATVDTLIPFSVFRVITKACDVPLYWKRALFLAVAGDDSEATEVMVSAILAFWRRVLQTCPDDASRFIYLLTRGKAQYLVPDDFKPIIQDVVDTHPSLTFLQAAPEFHDRYVKTVVARVFFAANASWSGRLSVGELRRSNFLQVLASLETEEDINLVTQFFSYEHFYVIYCKFWELDTNHDLIISKADLARHGNYAISERMIDRIFSGAVTRGTSFKEGTMTYSDFVWFLLAEEDKRHPRSIEYWFRCMDLDGDGVLSLYELEYFYSEQASRMEEMGIEPPTLEDCLCQCLDMVRPTQPDRIRLSDLKRCNLCPLFFDTFFNLPKYLQHEQRDPFSNLRDIEEGLTEISDWDRYASDTYDMLIASENGGGGGGGGGAEDDEDEDEEEDEEEEADVVVGGPETVAGVAVKEGDRPSTPPGTAAAAAAADGGDSNPTQSTEPAPA